MMTRLFLAILAIAMFSGCLLETRQHVVRPTYVAQCPAGYRYDGNYCRQEVQEVRVVRPAAVVVEVRPR